MHHETVDVGVCDAVDRRRCRHAHGPRSARGHGWVRDRGRIASVLRQDPAKLKLAAALLLTGPGVPFLYYGEEIGQIGAKPDEMIRNPMPWTDGTNGGFTAAARPWERLQKGFETRNVKWSLAVAFSPYMIT